MNTQTIYLNEDEAPDKPAEDKNTMTFKSAVRAATEIRIYLRGGGYIVTNRAAVRRSDLYFEATVARELWTLAGHFEALDSADNETEWSFSCGLLCIN